MHILGADRPAFLEFLRNLTPTVLLGGIALVTWERLDFHHWDFANWVSTATFYVCTLTACLSLVANTSNFLDQAFSPLPGADRAIRLLKFRHRSARKVLRGFIGLALRRNRIVFFEALIVLAVIYAAALGGAQAAVSAALTALRNGVR